MKIDPVLRDLALHLEERGKAEEEDIARERWTEEELAGLESGEPPPDHEVDP